MLSSIEGIVISVTPYGETSKIVNVFTKEHGVIGIMAKGATSIKSPFRSVCEKLTYGIFNIYYKENKLSTLVSIDIINHFKSIRSDIKKISYASYMTDLVTQVVKQHNDKNIYEDFINALMKIEEGLDPLVITNILEVKLLEYLGVELNLKSCISCGNNKDIVTLSSEKGGLLCKNCYLDEKILPISMIKVLNMYYLVDIKSIGKLKIDKDIIQNINNFLSNYYDDYTGLYLKSKSFLNNIVDL